MSETVIHVVVVFVDSCWPILDQVPVPVTVTSVSTAESSSILQVMVNTDPLYGVWSAIVVTIGGGTGLEII